MSYKGQYEKELALYKEATTKYEELTTAPRYHEILGEMPFEFLNAIQLCEKLSLYARLEKKPRMFFSSLEEAALFYKKLISFNKKTDILLDNASYIAEIGRLAEEINSIVKNSPYLNESFLVSANTEIINLAKKCLTEIPRYPDMLTKEFRWNYIESAILSLDKDDLKWMVDSKVIKSADIDHISLTEEMNDYHEKVEYLCGLLHHPQPVIAAFGLKLKGVTFPNEDGSSRQENLTMLKEYAEANPDKEIPLTARIYTYVPEIGAPEPAIDIAWDGKVIGNIARTTAEEILEKYTNPQLTATLQKVSGENKEGMNFGCVIKLNIIAPGYTQPQQNYEGTVLEAE